MSNTVGTAVGVVIGFASLFVVRASVKRLDRWLTTGPFCWRCWLAERQAGASLRVAWQVARGHR